MISRHPVEDPEITALRALILGRIREVYKLVAAESDLSLPPLESIDLFVTNDMREYIRHIGEDAINVNSLTALYRRAFADHAAISEENRLRRSIRRRHRTVMIGLSVNMTDAQFLDQLKIQPG